MKTLLLMRHGKSSWNDGKLDDHERPLKTSGRKDSQCIAKTLLANELIPDKIFCSSALRAKETAEILRETLDYQGAIIFSDDLYMAEPQDFIKILRTVGGQAEMVMILAHNPGLEAYLQIIDGDVESLPAGGLGYLMLAVDDWQEVSLETMGDLVDIWKPKAIKEQIDQSGLLIESGFRFSCE